jgi:hypothetical protein
MNLTATSTGQTVTCTITDEDGITVETFTVKDGSGVVRRIDKALASLMWDRSGFGPGMTATVTRPALYTLLTAVNG